MIKKKKFLKSPIFSIAMAGFVFLSTTISSFAGHKNYFLKTTVDYGGFGLLYDIKTDNAGGKSTGTGKQDSPYEERKNGYNYSAVRHYGNIGINKAYITHGDYNHFVTQNNAFLKVNFLKNINDNVTEKILDERYKELKKGDENAPLVFSFPGIIGDDEISPTNATSLDYSRANLVGETLITGLNQAIVFINNNSYTNLTSKNSLKYLLAKLSYTSEFSDGNLSSYSFEVGETSKGGVSTVIVSWVPGGEKAPTDKLIPVSQLDYRDYVKIQVKGGPNGTVYSYFPWRMEKGYRADQELFGNLSNAIQTKIKENDNAPKDRNTVFDENEYLTWGQLVLQAMLNGDTQGTSEQDYANDVQTIIGQGLGSDLSRTISSVRNMLGLASMSELVLNMGARPANYHLGVMTTDMHNIALTIYTLNLMISLLFVGLMIVRMLHQKMLGTTNIMAKTSLMEGIKDLAFVAVMLGFFAPLFEILLELNYLIVRTFSYSSEYMSAFNAMGNTALSMESMAGFMVSSMFLSIDMYINFVYLVREITVSFLFAIAPIIIVSYLWSPAQKNLVFGYFREIVGNIFMQSFHAITMTFFSAYNLSNMSTLQALASAYCFVPITQLFRQLVLGNSGGFSEKIGGKLAGQVSTMTTGLRNSAIKANQTKTLVDAQNKAQLEMTNASAKGGMVSTAGATLAGIGTSVATGALTGLATGSVTGPGALFTAGAGAVAGLVFGVGGAMIGKNVAKTGTQNALGELGSVQKNMADVSVGMGLAELGVGLGVSSYDSAGDRMVQSGLSNIQEGAVMSGRAQSSMSEGGLHLAQSAGNQVFYDGAGRTLSGMLYGVGSGINGHLGYNSSKKEFENSTTPVMQLESKEHVDAVLKCEHVGNFSVSKDMKKAMAHTNINGKDFDNGNSPLNNSSQGGNKDMYEAIKAFRSGDMEKMKEIKNRTSITDVLEDELGNINVMFDTVKSGFRAMEGVNMKNGIVNVEDVRISNSGSVGNIGK